VRAGICGVRHRVSAPFPTKHSVYTAPCNKFPLSASADLLISVTTCSETAPFDLPAALAAALGPSAGTVGSVAEETAAVGASGTVVVNG